MFSFWKRLERWAGWPGGGRIYLKLPNHVSESIKRLNPQLFAGAPVGPVAADQRKPNQGRTLDEVFAEEEARLETVRRSAAIKPRKSSPCVAVALIAATHRALDSDNLVAGFKPARDAIASWFGLDDNDDTVEWSYGQVRVSGQEGTVVMVLAL